ncbi:MAG: hypothetical protein ABIR16_02785 [Dokdonella sp.]
MSDTLQRWLLILFVLGCLGGWQHWRTREVAHDAGALATTAPLQTDPTNAAAFAFKQVTVTPLQQFELTARVLSRADYSLDRGASVSPIDLALGWGRMSDSTVLAQMSIHQAGRYFLWRSEKLPIPIDEVVSSSANMHLIPANASVERKLRETRIGDLVDLSGELVEVRADDGWHWRSSLTRTDNGDGACELVFVRRYEIRKR